MMRNIQLLMQQQQIRRKPSSNHLSEQQTDSSPETFARDCQAEYIYNVCVDEKKKSRKK